jgi:hypothetical protein
MPKPIEHSIEPPPIAPDKQIDWRMIGRVVAKAALLFLALNVLFAACRPLDALGNISLYNVVFPGRERLPYGEVPADDFNLTVNNLSAMLAAHVVDQPQATDELRVLLIGDSGTWGWFLDNEDTLAGQLNARDLRASDGRRIVIYNVAYPVMSLMKDLLLLDVALERTQADLIIWPVTLQSFARDRQLEHPLLHESAWRARALIERYDLALDRDDPRFTDRSFLQETMIGRRRDLADWLKLQAWGLAWAASGHDQAVPDEITLRRSDFEADESWLDIPEERPLTEDDLAFDVLYAGVERAGAIPVVIVNEPIFISSGINSDIRYNAFYPRWAYAQYRQMLSRAATTAGWTYFDLWDAIPPQEFTDTPVHLTPDGTRMVADIVEEFLHQQ